MIRSLKIKNHESHKLTKLVFSPGLNVFIGETDRGKSGIFRAYKLLTQNKPGGDWMRPLFWEGTTEIIGRFKDPDCTVIRKKGNSENTFQLNNEDPVNAGTSVPQNIAELLDLDETNLQTQVDRAFLMFETAGERGRVLNKIAGLSQIETTQLNAKADVSNLERALKDARDKKKSLKAQLEEFVDIEWLEDKVRVVEETQAMLKSTSASLSFLTKTIEKIKTIEIELEAKKQVYEVEQSLKKLSAKIEERKSIEKLVSSVSVAAQRIKYIEKVQSGSRIEVAEELIKQIQEVINKRIKADSTQKMLKRISSDIISVSNMMKQVEDRLKATLKNMPSVCSQCGRPL